MSFRTRDLALLAAGGIALIATAFLNTPRHKGSSRSVASVTPSASVASPLNEPPVVPPPVLHPFVFDCAPFAPAAASACPEPSGGGQALLAAASSYRVPPTPVWSSELADQVDAALASASRLDVAKLAPLERAALQNAALFLLSEATRFEKDSRAKHTATAARALVKEFALTSAEVTTLPGIEVASEWLGDAPTWQRGVAPRFMHTASDAFARAHRQLRRGDTLADIVRLVLVSKMGVPFVSNTVQRVVIKQTDADVVRVCIAELDPLGAQCGPPGALRVLAGDRGPRTLAPSASAPCTGCHVNNRPGSVAFGPDTGFDVDKGAVAQITGLLQPALRP